MKLIGYHILIPFILGGQVFVGCHDYTIKTIVGMVKDYVNSQYAVERLVRKGIDQLTELSPADQLNVISNPLPATSLLQHRCAFLTVNGARELKRITGLDFQSLMKLNAWRNAWDNTIEQECLPQRNVSCNSTCGVYRTLDGSCNNEKYPRWGMASRAQRRYLPAEYGDGVGALRDRSVTGWGIPSPREVSNVVFKAKSKPTEDAQLTVLHMSFGQFLDHDLIFTPITTDENGGAIECCDSIYKIAECIPIDIPKSDPDFNYRCMDLVRSLPAFNDNCFNGSRDQLNQATSFLDASNVYGSSDEKANSLRLHKDGLLKLGIGDGLPEGKTKCFKDVPSDYCQDAGDKRVNVVPNLSAVHLLFVLEHNRIARGLRRINPFWDDDTLYFEARRIMIAEMQHIVYSEYLPPVIGEYHMNFYNLTEQKEQYFGKYDDELNPTITNVFGVAAFRFGHSQITDTQQQFNKSHEPINVTDIVNTYHRPHFCEMNKGAGYAGVMRWMTEILATKADREFEPGVRNKLFPTKNGRTFDLPAINTQRGRDHGIPTYNKWREWCGLPKAKRFFCRNSGLLDHDNDAIKALASVYRATDDIDLFAGAISERHLEGASVGPTFACIISRQFRDLKFGDRFWYENGKMAHSFGYDQLKNIKNMTMSNIICKNFDLDEIQPYAFMQQTNGNEYMPCKDLPDIDFSLWKSTNLNRR